jgi:hypothetical protein
MVFVFLLIYFYFFVKDKYKKYQLVTLAHGFWNKITHHQERQAKEKRTKASHALFNLSSIRFHPVMDYGLTQSVQESDGKYKSRMPPKTFQNVGRRWRLICHLRYPALFMAKGREMLGPGCRAGCSRWLLQD